MYYLANIDVSFYPEQDITTTLAVNTTSSQEAQETLKESTDPHLSTNILPPACHDLAKQLSHYLIFLFFFFLLVLIIVFLFLFLFFSFLIDGRARRK